MWRGPLGAACLTRNPGQGKIMLRYIASVPAPGSFLKKFSMLGKIYQKVAANVHVISFCLYRTHLPYYTDQSGYKHQIISSSRSLQQNYSIVSVARNKQQYFHRPFILPDKFPKM